jgi:hypothetical protein
LSSTAIFLSALTRGNLQLDRGFIADIFLGHSVDALADEHDILTHYFVFFIAGKTMRFRGVAET